MRGGAASLAFGLLLSACAGEATSDPSGPCGEPGDGWLTYTTRRAGQFDVRLVREDGACDRALAESPAEELDGSLSAAGRVAVHWVWRDGRGRLAVTDLAKGSIRELDTGPLVVANPAVSPDGRAVAYEGSLPPAGPELHVRSLADGTDRVAAPDPAADVAPAWTEGGRALVFGSMRGGSYQLWRVRLDGSEPVRLTDDARAALRCGDGACPVNGRPAPRPDGTAVAFARASGAGASVVVLELATGEERLLADALDAEPSFSADGRRLAVMNLDLGDPEVLIRDAATGAVVRRLTASPGVDGSPAYAQGFGGPAGGGGGSFRSRAATVEPSGAHVRAFSSQASRSAVFPKEW